MAGTASPLLKWFKVMHGVGLVLIAAGGSLLLMTQMVQSLNGVLVISSLLGIGGVLVSPFPVALFFQWANAVTSGQSSSSAE